MAHYILLLTLTTEGREQLLADPHSVIIAEEEIREPGVMGLGLYAVLGSYDFVNIVEAPDNDAIARYSIQLGVRAGAHVTTLPAVPVAQLRDRPLDDLPFLREGAEAGPGVANGPPPGA